MPINCDSTVTDLPGRDATSTTKQQIEGQQQPEQVIAREKSHQSSIDELSDDVQASQASDGPQAAAVTTESSSREALDLGDAASSHNTSADGISAGPPSASHEKPPFTAAVHSLGTPNVQVTWNFESPALATAPDAADTDAATMKESVAPGTLAEFITQTEATSEGVHGNPCPGTEAAKRAEFETSILEPEAVQRGASTSKAAYSRLDAVPVITQAEAEREAAAEEVEVKAREPNARSEATESPTSISALPATKKVISEDGEVPLGSEAIKSTTEIPTTKNVEAVSYKTEIEAQSNRSPYPETSSTLSSPTEPNHWTKGFPPIGYQSITAQHPSTFLSSVSQDIPPSETSWFLPPNKIGSDEGGAKCRSGARSEGFQEPKSTVCIFEPSGKPIYSKGTSATDAAVLTAGILAALLSVAESSFTAPFISSPAGDNSGDDDPHCLADRLLWFSLFNAAGTAREVTACLLQRPQFHLVYLSRSPHHCPRNMVMDLKRLCLQFESLFPCSSAKSLSVSEEALSGIMEARRSFPLFLQPSHLGGLTFSDLRQLNILCAQLKVNFALAIGAVEILPLNPLHRYIAHSAIRGITTPEPILCGFILAGSRAVALSTSPVLDLLPNQRLHSRELSCLITLLMSSQLPTRGAATPLEQWFPFIFPSLCPSSYVYCYVNYVSDAICVCYLSSSGSTQQFDAIHTFCIQRCIPVLVNAGVLSQIASSMSACPLLIPREAVSGGSEASTLLLQQVVFVTKRNPRLLDEAFQTLGDTLAPTGPNGSSSSPDSATDTVTDSEDKSVDALLAREHESKAEFWQTFSSALMAPDSGYRDNELKTLRRIFRLYRLARSLSRERLERSSPVQILIETTLLRIFAFIGEEMQVFCCTPAWSELPEDGFRSVLQWIQDNQASVTMSWSQLRQCSGDSNQV